MLKNICIFIIILNIFSSCSDTKVDIDQIFKNSNEPERDMVFYELVRSFQEDKPSGFAIVDRAVNNNNQFRIDTADVYWNKALFPEVTFIKKDSLFWNNQPDKMHLEYTDKYKEGYMEITKPYYVNPDKELVHIEVKYYQWNRIWVYRYTLEKEMNRYVITEDELVAQLYDNEIEYADPYYRNYIPYAGFKVKKSN